METLGGGVFEGRGFELLVAERNSKVGQRMQVTVDLTAEFRTSLLEKFSSAEMELPLRVHLTAPGFDNPSPSCAVTFEDGSAQAVFPLTATQQGKHVLEAEVFYGANRVGYAVQEARIA